MRVIQLTARADADGRLRFDVPDADAGIEYEVAVVLQTRPSANGRTPTPEERGWPPGYFESIGNLDDTFTAPLRELPSPVPPLDLQDESK